MIINEDCFKYIEKISNNSVDLILTDPPYLISRKSGFCDTKLDKYKNLSIDFGDWDKEEIDFDLLFKEYYRVLKPGGYLIFFFDIWKSTLIKDIATKYKFKQHRVCQWLKSNPVPVNSKKNYLSNCTEYFFTFVKGSNPTFNSEYDNGVYTYPICSGNERTKHPTQKPLKLIKDLILKHSNEGDLILDTFGGSGTTAVAAKELNRDYIIIELSEEYVDIIKERLNK